MCVMYVSFGSKVRPRNFRCVSMDSAVLCILRSRLLLYSAGSGVNRLQVVLSGSSMRLILFCPGKNLMYAWLYIFIGCTRACVCGCDGDVICVGHGLNWCTGWW